jgi:hypothetical protein
MRKHPKIVSARTTNDMYTNLHSISEKLNIPVSALVYGLLLRYLDEYEFSIECSKKAK